MSLLSRNFKVIKAAAAEKAPGAQQARHKARQARRAEQGCALPPDSLACSLWLAARVLADVGGGKSLPDALAARFASGAPRAARASVQDIAYGVLRRYGWAEFLLARLLRAPLGHAEVDALLRAALYRLETRPDAVHAVVDQAVRAAGKLTEGAFKGLVNGVLRNYLRQREVLLAAAARDEVAGNWHPRWWLQRLQRRWPAQWGALVAASNAPPPMTLRVNARRGAVAAYLARLQAAGLAARPLGGSAVQLEQPAPVEALPGFFEGDVSVQDYGAQRAAELLAPLSGMYAPVPGVHAPAPGVHAPVSGMRVLDACAAPGGKTSHLLELADLDLLALDLDGARVERIRENLRRLHLVADVCVGDASRPADWWDGRPFDAILADVPCSASGVARRHPDIKALRRESDVRRFARTQSAMLDALWPLLRVGGRLLYATCSLFDEENKGQVDAFLYRHADARRLVEEQWLPCLENDGFYYALLEKQGDQNQSLAAA